MMKSFALGFVAGMPLAATVMVAVLTLITWKTPRKWRVIASREKFRAMIRGRFMHAAFGVISGIAQALAYRFCGP